MVCRGIMLCRIWAGPGSAVCYLTGIAMAASSRGAAPEAGPASAGAVKEPRPFYESMTRTVFTFKDEEEAETKLPKIVHAMIMQAKDKIGGIFEVHVWRITYIRDACQLEVICPCYIPPCTCQRSSEV